MSSTESAALAGIRPHVLEVLAAPYNVLDDVQKRVLMRAPADANAAVRLAREAWCKDGVLAAAHTALGRFAHQQIRKSDAGSALSRKRGKEAHERDIHAAHGLYTEAIATATPHGAQWCYALANRSVALARIGNTDEALRDLTLAIDDATQLLQQDENSANAAAAPAPASSSSSDDQTPRTKISLLGPGQKAKTSESKHEYETVVPEATIQKWRLRRQTFLQRAPSLAAQMAKARKPPPPPERALFGEGVVERVEDAPNLSPRRGRYLCATRDIERGQPVLIEPALAIVLKKTAVVRYCNHCAVPMPIVNAFCETCSVGRYCSKKCLEADEPIHFCNGVDMFLPESLILAYRLSCREDFDSKNWHLHNTIGSPKQLCELATGATLLEQLCNVSAEELMRLTSLVVTNAIALSHEVVETPSNGAGTLRNVIGSCRPNAFVRTQGSTVTISTLRNVKAGDELFISYGPEVRREPRRDERRRVLREKYFFECCCEACVDPEQPDANAFAQYNMQRKVADAFDAAAIQAAKQLDYERAARIVERSVAGPLTKIFGQNSLECQDELWRAAILYQRAGNEEKANQVRSTIEKMFDDK